MSSNLTVEEVLELWPETAVVFRKYTDACVGCTLAGFCTLEDAAREYDANLNQMLADLSAAIQ
ncbi:MAG: hypothetical protein ACE5FD_14845 [Anaerolineae bacterium]